MNKEQELKEALEPFAAMGKFLEKTLILSGENATDSTNILTITNESEQATLTYGNFLDALATFGDHPRPWSGMYRKLRKD